MNTTHSYYRCILIFIVDYCFLQVKIQPVAKYDWEHKYYYGNLIAVSNSFLAYAIRGKVPEAHLCATFL